MAARVDLTALLFLHYSPVAQAKLVKRRGDDSSLSDRVKDHEGWLFPEGVERRHAVALLHLLARCFNLWIFQLHVL